MFQLPSAKYWNTWSSGSPAAMVFLPAGFEIRVGAYSYKGQSCSFFPFSPDTTLYEHHPDGRYCRLQVSHEGTRLEIEYLKTDDWTIVGCLRSITSGEWGLRFWPLVSFGFTGEGSIAREGPSAHGSLRSYQIAWSLENQPVRACLADDSEQLGRRMVELGYYAPLTDAEKARWYSVAYNLEETPRICFAVSVGNDYRSAKDTCSSAIALAASDGGRDDRGLQSTGLATLQGLLRQTTGEYPSAAEAIRDVMAWNGIADTRNSRTYTSLTRFWIDRKFGGWFVWLDDIFYHALINLWAGDWTMARRNIAAGCDNQVPAGNLACLMSEFTEWVDRSQPPIGSFILLKYHLVTGDRQLLEEVYPALRRAHLWWYEHRDGNANGILEYGSSMIGNGHFNGTKLAAKDEAAMDNSPLYDSARFVAEAGTLDMEDIALNSLLALDGECLVALAEALGDGGTATDVGARVAKLKRDIDAVLWDDTRKLYANRHWEKGFVSPSPTSFYPLAAGIPSEQRVEHLLRHLFDEGEFWTQAPFPSIWLKDPAVDDNVYWRGRSWPPLTFLIYVGLKRYGRDEEANRVVTRVMANFDRIWRSERRCYENHNARTGEGKDSVDSDPYYGWGALLPLMWILEHIDVDPWNGFHFGSVTGNEVRLEGIKMRDGTYDLEVRSGRTSLYRDHDIILDSNARGRFRHFRYEAHYAAVQVGPQRTACEVAFPRRKPVRALINGREARVGTVMNVAKETRTLIEVWD